MWVINPEGLPDSGKVAAVISSAFGSVSEASKKRKGRLEWDNTVLLKRGYSKWAALTKVLQSTKGNWRTRLFPLCFHCVFPHGARSAKALRASFHPFKTQHISLSVLKIGTQRLPVEFHLNSTWEHKRLITAITKACSCSPMCDRTGSGSIKAWPSREPGGWKRRSNRRWNGPGGTQDYVSAIAWGERRPSGPDIYQRRSDPGWSSRTPIISEQMMRT